MANVPIAGNVPKPVLLIGAVAGAGALGYAWYRDRKKKAAAATAPPADTTGTTTDSTSYGYGAYADEGAYAYGAYTYNGEPYGYGGFNAGLPYAPAASVAGAPETNAQWTQSVVTGLGDAYDKQAVLDALGAYLRGAQVTADQDRIIGAAIATNGYPPVAGTGGYPPNVKSSPPAGQVSGSQATVPNVVGGTMGHAYNVLTGAGLVPGYPGGTGSEWIVKAQSVKPGTVVNKGTLVKLTVPKPK
jgi:hypothetical protein